VWLYPNSNVKIFTFAFTGKAAKDLELSGIICIFAAKFANMGTYINIGNEGFATARNGEYVDKSGLIAVINATIDTKRKFSCVTRSRRFGKSMAAEMLCAYYDHSCDSRNLFADLEIVDDPTFEKHLNKYPVIYLDMTDFVARFKDDSIVAKIQQKLKEDVLKAYPQIQVSDDDDLMETLIAIYGETDQKFIMIIDEWDAICREFKPGTAAMDDYVSWLRYMFKSANTNRAFAAVYMTGILPIKKYKTESALNNFTEYSMVKPGKLAKYFGFTKEEVRVLAKKNGGDFEELVKWYDGYRIGDEPSMFNPNSVMMALWDGQCQSFWASTGAFDAVAHYINMNFGGLKDDIIKMLAGGCCKVDPTGFQNDMSVIRTKDDALTVLIHLGYLSYDWVRSECYIPNREVAGEMVNAIKANNWTPVVDALQASEQLLQAVLNGDAETVAKGVDAAHDENTSILSYNDENSLACVLSLAFYYAKNDYIFHRELPTGKGFADLVLMPRKKCDSLAILLELKKDQSANTAIEQIHQKQYQGKILQYDGHAILVGINYDSKSKKHDCKIEQL